MSAPAELSSVSTALGDLKNRVISILDALGPIEAEDYGRDLAEVERNLGAAQRRLARLVEQR